jgi:hypothetical protein
VDTKEKALTQDRLRELLSYDPYTGLFIRLRSIRRHKAGEIAGAAHGCGYVVIWIDQYRYLAHRLAWFYVYGKWPNKELDHRNGSRADNRIANLREATNPENSQNRSIRSDSTSGYPGVTWQKSRGKWQAKIGFAGTRRHLGLYDTPELAFDAYRRAKAQFHEFNKEQRI